MTARKHPADKIGTAIIGPGKVAHIHARALAALPESNFVAVWGRNAERTEAFATQYGIRAHTNMDEMLHDPAIEAVIICTPHSLHAEETIAAAQAGVHVLVEKPVALTVADCDRMIAAAHAAGIQLGVISQRRLYEPVQRVKQAIESGKIGKPILGTVTVLGWRGPEYYAMDAWRGTWDGEGGGILVNQVVHQLDLFQWFMGPVAELFGYWDNLNHPYIQVDDTAVAVLRFRNGALGNIVVSNSQNPGLYAKIHVHGYTGASIGVQTDGGSVFFAGQAGRVEPPINDLWTIPGEESLLAQWQAEDRARGDEHDPMTYYHFLQDREFLQAILANRPPMVTGEEGRKLVEIVEAIYCSQKEHAAIRFP
ncbi:MAG: Gfo/Idh/MocA family oxidoreductase [Anaerolineae bacterium]